MVNSPTPRSAIAFLPSHVRSKYQFVKKYGAEHDINTMCRLRGVARSGYVSDLPKSLPRLAEKLVD